MKKSIILLTCFFLVMQIHAQKRAVHNAVKKDSIRYVPIPVWQKIDTLRYPKTVLYKGENGQVLFEDSTWVVLERSAVKDSAGHFQYLPDKNGIKVIQFLHPNKDSISFKKLISY